MSCKFSCSYLNALVELTEERSQHIAQTHPGTLPEYLAKLEATLADPDLIRSSGRDPSTLLFSQWFQAIRTGRYLIVVVVHQIDSPRH